MHGITILHDFNWADVFAHERATFRNGKCLAALVIDNCPEDYEPVLLLTQRTNVAEGRLDHDEKYVIVVNIDNYLKLASGNAATTYFAMLASVDPVSAASIRWDSIPRDQVAREVAARLDYDMLRHWLEADQSRIQVIIDAFKAMSVDTRLLVEGREAEALEVLVELLGDDVWASLSDLGAEVPDAVARRRLWQRRSSDAAMFRSHLEASDWNEPDWQKFFEERPWIFGYGLRYQFLHLLEQRPYVGARDVTRRGGQESDFLMSTSATARFTVLVDIKTPSADLVRREEYRNRTYAPGSDLVGGVAQVQQQAWRWATEGSRTDHNRELLEEKGIFTHEPHGILVIGNLSSLENQRSKIRSFESFRRNLRQPEILTFDELLERAERMVDAAESSSDA